MTLLHYGQGDDGAINDGTDKSGDNDGDGGEPYRYHGHSIERGDGPNGDAGDNGDGESGAGQYGYSGYQGHERWEVVVIIFYYHIEVFLVTPKKLLSHYLRVILEAPHRVVTKTRTAILFLGRSKMKVVIAKPCV